MRAMGGSEDWKGEESLVSGEELVSVRNGSSHLVGRCRSS
jgi:hypothetical protein